MSYTVDEWFGLVTGHAEPHGWQRRLGGDGACRDRVIRIPTGMGKTEGVLAAWAYHRVARGDERWPRRLVWCLPMRVLVEQTEQVARAVAARMPEEGRPGVYVVMGGVDDGEWFLEPERAAVIVGTQDMLLSRGMNRGYGSARARWPMEFGLLSQDALWVMDEVQLMDVGLATSAQLQAYRAEDAEKGMRPCHTWWMSATLQESWLKSVDTKERHGEWVKAPCVVPPRERSGALWEGKKSLRRETAGAGDAARFAEIVLGEHAAAEGGEWGRISLVVCNTVERAKATFEALRRKGRQEGVELVHSRYRPAEREGWREGFLSRAACKAGVDRIIVATQVVEAGVDVSAVSLVTELAPWASLVQRFGRCARYGGAGRVTVVERAMEERAAAPYSGEELASAWEALGRMEEVGIGKLEEYEAGLSEAGRARLYPYAPAHLLMRTEYDELFDTTPDLSGGDLDVSRYIRTGEERDLQVFWLEVEKGAAPAAERKAERRELCPVPFLKARDWLCGEETKTKKKPRLRAGMRAWVWDWLDGAWEEAERSKLLPGRVVCVEAGCGGYVREMGFDAESKGRVGGIEGKGRVAGTEVGWAVEESDDRQDSEALSVSGWKTIATHGREVAAEAVKIAESLGLRGEVVETIREAGYWHDVGKSHAAFQGMMRGEGRPGRQDLAKAPDAAWVKPWGDCRSDDGERRPGLRHELASALAVFGVLERYEPGHEALLGRWKEALERLGAGQVREGAAEVGHERVEWVRRCGAEWLDLLVYLVASHHGKVRVALHAAPKDQEYADRDGRGMPIRGVREGDRLPGIEMGDGAGALPELELTLEPAAMGLSKRTGASWRERSLGLQGRFGPGGLAYLEAVLRAADVRASRLKTGDPLLGEEAGA